MKTRLLILKLLFVMLALLLCVTVSRAQIPFPISVSQDDHFPDSGGYMHTEANISRTSDGSGQLTARTHTWEVTDFRGFRGSVAVAVFDGSKALLWVSKTLNYGVDGRMVPFGGPSDRTEDWTDTIPAQDLSRARYVAIKQRWNPRPVADDINAWLRGVGNAGDELGTALKDLVQGPPVTCQTGSEACVATNVQTVTPPSEEVRCEADPLRPLKAPAYYIPPRDMLEWAPTQSHGDNTLQGFRPPQPTLTSAMYDSPPDTAWPQGSGNSGPIAGAPVSTLGANEGRLRPELRDAARSKDPVSDLCQAALRFTRNGPASGNTPSDHDFGNAFADLSVTGKATFASFVQLHPNEAILSGNRACSGASRAAIAEALDRAYGVANALRGPHESPARQALGWIAVSGEDDQPYRPVNVPSNKGEFPEFQLEVVVPKFNIAVNTRYMIAHARPMQFPSPAHMLVNGGPKRQVSADPLPALANDAEVILFINGMDSRLEEADDLTAALHRLGVHNWTVISMDLPTSGYADNINHQRISPIEQVACHNTPLVEFIEDFIVAFVDKLDEQLQRQLKPKIKAVVGGSLGGNMTMRLGRRPNTPWVTHVVPWSPASIWPSMIAQRNTIMGGCDTPWDPFKDRAVNQSLRWAGLIPYEQFLPENETPELRREFFYGGFDWDGGDFVAIFSSENHKPQADCWFSDKWPCKKATILAARLDRQETYNANFRAWHWRLGAEQLAFSHQLLDPVTHKPLYLLNTKRMLLFGGLQDVCGDLCAHTQEVASKMVYTPGYARFLVGTGHSLDNEHPDWIARQIASFIEDKRP